MSGLDRLDLMLQKYSNNALQKIVNHLKNLKNVDTAIYLNEEKNLEDMYNYLKFKAKEFALNNVAIIEDEKVYEWSLKYFQLSNDNLGFKKENFKVITKNNDIVDQKIMTSDKEQLTLF